VKTQNRRSIVALSLLLRTDALVSVGMLNLLIRMIERRRIIPTLVLRRTTAAIQMESLVLGVTQLIPTNDGSYAMFHFVPKPTQVRRGPQTAPLSIHQGNQL